jgi:hypothetical protein
MWIVDVKCCFPIISDIRFVPRQPINMAQRLQDDLLYDFRDQKKVLIEQIELFDPLATSMRRPAAQRLMSKGGLILAEILCYLLFLGMIAFAILMNRIYPFAPLENIRYIKSMHEFTLLSEAEYFSMAVHAMAAFIGLLFLTIGRIIRTVRLKNDILDLAGKNIKMLVGQHLQRKAAIESIEQRHFHELPGLEESVRVNLIPNPGYDSNHY